MKATALVTLCLSLLVIVYGRSILTQNVDGSRSGWNSNESTLTVANVKNLKLLGTASVVRACTTQILYYENINIAGHKNVIFCWTNPDNNNANSTVYAFDADALTLVWSLYIGPVALWTTQAPAIDPATNIMYFVYKNDNDDGFNHLIAIDIMNGKMMPDSPKLINATVPGTGDASVNGQVVFQNTADPGSGHRIHENSRTSVLIVNSVVIIGFAHNSDSFPYHGWVFTYKYDTAAQKFDQLAVFCTSPNNGENGVWQSGQGIMTDGKYIYYTTGNGAFDVNKKAWGMAVIKMSIPQLDFVDYFVPANWKQWSDRDWDLGGCGPTLLPNTHYLVVGVTKYGQAHLIDTDNMGKYNANNDSCRQSIVLNNGFVAPGGNPVAWDTGKTVKIYLWAPGLDIVQLTFDHTTEMISNNQVKWTGSTSGGGLAITSNGPNDAILWAFGHSGMVYAFDASKDISDGPLWTGRASGPASWAFPTITNGKVFINGGDSKIYVFGL